MYVRLQALHPTAESSRKSIRARQSSVGTSPQTPGLTDTDKIHQEVMIQAWTGQCIIIVFISSFTDNRTMVIRSSVLRKF